MIANKRFYLFLGELLRLIFVSFFEPPLNKLLVDLDLAEAHALEQRLEQRLGLSARDFWVAFICELGEDLGRDQLCLLLHRNLRVI